jgi:DNA repair protein SbcD/Mre11
VRILHLADVHLDRPFVALPFEAAQTRRRELFDALRRCLGLARDHGVDLVTIGGDLWEEEHVRTDTMNSVAHEFGALSIQVLICCGNHDPLLPGGSYRRTRWPSNVEIAPLRTPKEYPYGDISIWGVSWGGDGMPANVLTRVDIPPNGRKHILVIHGSSTEVAFGDLADYFPFSPSDVRAAGFDRCLAGHVHMASDEGGVVYPGSPEPLGWGEVGRHCAALVDATAESIGVQLIDVNEKHYETREIDCHGCGSSVEIERRTASALDDADSDRIFLRARLLGEIGPDCVVDAGALRGQHASRYGALVIEDATEPLLDIARRAERKGLDGVFVRKMQELIAEAPTDRELKLAELALQAGLRALERRDVILRVD